MVQRCGSGARQISARVCAKFSVRVSTWWREPSGKSAASGASTWIVEAPALAAVVSLHQGEPQHQVTHAECAEGHYRLGDRHHRPAAAELGDIGEFQEPASDGRVGLDQMDQVVDLVVVAPQQLDDGERHALRGRQAPRGLELLVQRGVHQAHLLTRGGN